jgi:hypothetical protein
MHTEIWSGNLKERFHVEDLDAHGKMKLKWINLRVIGYEGRVGLN